MIPLAGLGQGAKSLDAEALGRELAEALNPGTALLLYGDLGAGKTTLAREVVRNLTGAEDVVSPTFTLVQIYEGNSRTVAHYDLYRLRSVAEVFELDLDANLANNIVIIEWPEIIAPYLKARPHIAVRLEIRGAERFYTLNSNT